MKYILWVLLLMGSFRGVAQKASSPAEVRIFSMASVSPVMKRMPANPLLRLAIYIPPGMDSIDFRVLHCRLNAPGIQAIQRLDIYDTRAEPGFAGNLLLTSVHPGSGAFDIPLAVTSGPGLHYLWCSVSLKDDADMRGYVELHAESLMDASGGRYPVKEGDPAGYRKRVGIALRKAGDDGVNTYRIPGLITTDAGTLIAVYDIRYNNSRDLPNNIDIGMSRSTDKGRTWEPMKVIMDMGAPDDDNGVGDPCVLYDPVRKKIWVAALWSKGDRSIRGSRPGLSPDESGQFMLVSSNDDGKSWSAPMNITRQVKDPAWNIFFQGPGRGIAMQDGALVFPAQFWDSARVPHSTIIYSEDGGATWKRGVGAKSKTTESQVIETSPGTLMLNMRDDRGSYRAIAVSPDMGRSWVEHPTSSRVLPDPVCMGSIMKTTSTIHGRKEEAVYFCNPHSSADRRDLSIQASLDLGESWPAGSRLLVDERPCYGYSCLTPVDDDTLGVLYEGVKDLYFVLIPVNEIFK